MGRQRDESLALPRTSSGEVLLGGIRESKPRQGRTARRAGVRVFYCRTVSIPGGCWRGCSLVGGGRVMPLEARTDGRRPSMREGIVAKRVAGCVLFLLSCLRTSGSTFSLDPRFGRAPSTGAPRRRGPRKTSRGAPFRRGPSSGPETALSTSQSRKLESARDNLGQPYPAGPHLLVAVVAPATPA